MAKLIAMYRHPEDTAAFEKHYFEIHMPLAKQLPGLINYEVNRGEVTGGQWHLVAVLTFASYEAMTAALESDVGKAAHADVQKFGQAGVELITFDTRPVPLDQAV